MNVGLVYALLESLVSKVQKIPSPALEPRTVLGTKAFHFGAILQSCLVS
jgi:hypothetical protein